MKPMEPLMAFLLDPHDGTPRQTCLGCSGFLEKLGMLRVVGEVPMQVMNAEPGTYSAITYAIVKPFTLENCRALVRDRHVGPPEWGGEYE